MPATPFSIDVEAYNCTSSTSGYEPEELREALDKLSDEFEELEPSQEASSLSPLSKPTARNTTDLVRLYLSEIGRVPLLRRDEEVSEAQKVQRYIHLLAVRSQAISEGDPVLEQLAELNNIYDRLVSQLNHRPALKRWAAAADMEVYQLKQALKTGKQRWAQAAQLSVQELEEIEQYGVRAKERMIRSNLRLVVSVAKKYQNRGLELLDLIQEGTLGLERAVEKFDPTKGYRFSTYAYWWIRQGITRAIASQSRTIRLPVHITEKLNKIKKAQRKISQKQGHLATIEDIARELEMTPPQVREVLVRVPRSISLELKVGKEKDTELGDLLETQSISPEEAMTRESLQHDIQTLLAELTSREREVIQMRYGLSDGRPYSLAEIGRVLELSRERVRQIEAKALHKLQQPKRRNRVRDYLETFS